MNILLITTDHMRFDNVCANGNHSMVTPALDRMCEQGTRFTRCITPSPVCQPARASLFTGRYPSCHGVRRNGIVLPEDEITLQHVLADSGYYCGHFGKLHFLPHKERNHRAYHPLYGFHEMRMSDEPGCYPDDYGRWLDALGPDAREAGRTSLPGTTRGPMEHYIFRGDPHLTHAWWTASETIRFIHDNKDRPFFCNTGFYAPHPPLIPPQDSFDLYEGSELKPRVYREGEMEDMPAFYKKSAERYADLSEEEWKTYRRFFYAMVSDVDRNTGRIINALKQEDLLDDTLIIFTSDHGDYLGDHGLQGKGMPCYNQVLNVPLVIQGPSIPRQNVCEEIVELTDIMPTVCSMAGADIPYGVQGMDIFPVITRDEPGREYAYCEYYTDSAERLLTGKKTKYCLYASGEEVLFDLEHDPDELYNTASQPESRQLLDTMRMKLHIRSMNAVDPKPERIDWY